LRVPDDAASLFRLIFLLFPAALLRLQSQDKLRCASRRRRYCFAIIARTKRGTFPPLRDSKTNPAQELTLSRILALMLMSLVLAACGGGGGGGDTGGSGGGGGGSGGGGGGGGGGNGGGGNNPPPNTAPTVTLTSFSVDQDSDLGGTITATDAENDALTFAKKTDPSHGAIVAFQTNGTFTYRPTAGYSGADSFTITASDATHNVDATINITVNAVTPPPPNHAPTASDDIVTVSGASPLIDVLANDSDPDGDPLTITIEGTPSVGTATVVSGKVQLTLPAGYRGFARFKYHVADAGGLGASANAAVFVDAQRVRLVYQTDEENLGIQNLYVNDLTDGPHRVSALTSTSTTFLGRNNVSANGRTLLWEEATGDLGVNYHAQSIWTIPADRSSAARQISPALQAGDELSVRSALSADGKWVVYGVKSSGVETLYLANLLPGGTSVRIPVPAGALRIETGQQGIVFGPTSQYVYFTATSDFGAPTVGQATYRIPVSDPTAAVRLSTAAIANRSVAIPLVSSDDSRVLQVSVDTVLGAPAIELIDTSAPGTEITLSHVLAAGEELVSIGANASLSHVAYVVQTVAPDLNLYFATNTASSGTLVGQIASDVTAPTPMINAVSASGDAALVSRTRLVSGNPVEDLLEVQLAGSGTQRTIQTNPAGLNMYGYVDDSQTISFTADPGVAVAPRANPADKQVLFDHPAAFYEFSQDNQLLAVLQEGTSSSGLHLFLVSRVAGGSAPLQITGETVDASEALSARIVPVN
jgi:Big-like domain-containing protein